MPRADVEEHVAASAAVHLCGACKMVAEMEEKVGRTLAEQTEVIKEQAAVIREQGKSIVEQKAEIAGLVAGLQRSAAALTHVFTWSTDSAWNHNKSDSFTFANGVCGHGDNDKRNGGRFMWFILEGCGLECTFHFKCWILDKDDKVIRVISPPEREDFRTPPTVVSFGITGCFVTVSDQDKAAAVRADGSIKLSMLVHLYLP